MRGLAAGLQRRTADEERSTPTLSPHKRSARVVAESLQLAALVSCWCASARRDSHPLTASTAGVKCACCGHMPQSSSMQCAARMGRPHLCISKRTGTPQGSRKPISGTMHNKFEASHLSPLSTSQPPASLRTSKADSGTIKDVPHRRPRRSCRAAVRGARHCCVPWPRTTVHGVHWVQAV